MLLVAQISRKIAAEGGISVLFDGEGALGAANARREVKLRAVGVELIVQHIVDGFAVYLQQLVAGRKTQRCGWAFGIHFFNFYRHAHTSFYKSAYR